jgi:hypothetical protein
LSNFSKETVPSSIRVNTRVVSGKSIIRPRSMTRMKIRWGKTFFSSAVYMKTVVKGGIIRLSIGEEGKNTEGCSVYTTL